MIRSLLIFLFFIFQNINANAFELYKVEANSDFDRVDVWSGTFLDYSGDMWDVSEYYYQENNPFKVSLFFKNMVNGLNISSKLYYDNGYKSALLDVDPLIYLSISSKYSLSKNSDIKLVLDPLISIGGKVTESPCYDSFRRAYHCGTGMAWSDARSGGFLKKYDQDQSIKISYSVSF